MNPLLLFYLMLLKEERDDEDEMLFDNFLLSPDTKLDKLTNGGKFRPVTVGLALFTSPFILTALILFLLKIV